MPHPLRAVAIAITLSVVCCVAGAATIVPLHTVALTGQPAPGHGAGVNVGTIHISSLTNTGWATMGVGLSGPGVAPGTEDSRWRWRAPVGLQLVVRQRVTPAPGDPDRTFEVLGRLTLTSALAARNTYDADLVAGAPRGIYTDAFGSMTKVIRRDDPAPGFPAGAQVWSVGEGARSRNGALAVDATVRHASEFTQMLWLRTSSGLQTVARSGTPAPATTGLPNGATWEGPYRGMLINDGGATVFTAMTGRTPDTRAGASLWTVAPGTSAKALAVIGNAAPGLEPGRTFTEFAPATINRHGTVVFAAESNSISPSGNFGLWTASPDGSIELRVAPDRAAPGYPAGVRMHSNHAPSINASGDVLFSSTLHDGATFRTTHWFSKASGALREVVALGAQAPGLGDGVTLDVIGTPGANELGQVFFWSRLAGPGITIFNRDSLWAWDESAGLRLLAREGDEIQVAPGDVRLIIDLPRQDGFGANEDGAGNRLNDLGQLAFHAGLSGGQTGAFIITVPEPATTGAIGIAALSLCRRRHRRARRA